MVGYLLEDYDGMQYASVRQSALLLGVFSGLRYTLPALEDTRHDSNTCRQVSPGKAGS